MTHKQRVKRLWHLYTKLRRINDDIQTVAMYQRLGLKPKGMHYSDGKVPWPKARKA